MRDLRSVCDADPDGQLWAQAMADTLLDAHHTATTARDTGATALGEATLKTIRSRYHGALARGTGDNHGRTNVLAGKARTLINRFRRYEDMILRFATDLTVPFTNNQAERAINQAERAIRPAKIQQRLRRRLVTPSPHTS